MREGRRGEGARRIRRALASGDTGKMDRIRKNRGEGGGWKERVAQRDG